jgi:hypothetical protein
MTKSARQRVALAGVLILAFDAALAGVARASGFEPSPPAPLRLAVPLLLAAPGVLALVAAATDRRTVAVAAAILCFPQALLSFSGVTLVFLIPAFAILRSVGAGDTTPSDGEPAASARRRTIGLREGATGAAIVVLVVGAWVAILGLTETVCSVARLGPTGDIAWERVPATDQLTGGAGTVGESCASGQPRPEALALASGLLGAALLRAILPIDRRRPDRQRA